MSSAGLLKRSSYSTPLARIQARFVDGETNWFTLVSAPPFGPLAMPIEDVWKNALTSAMRAAREQQNAATIICDVAKSCTSTEAERLARLASDLGQQAADYYQDALFQSDDPDEAIRLATQANAYLSRCRTTLTEAEEHLDLPETGRTVL